MSKTVSTIYVKSHCHPTFDSSVTTIGNQVIVKHDVHKRQAKILTLLKPSGNTRKVMSFKELWTALDNLDRGFNKNHIRHAIEGLVERGFVVRGKKRGTYSLSKDAVDKFAVAKKDCTFRG